MSLADILEQQRRWALRRWPEHSGVCAPSIKDNLFTALQQSTWNEFAAASGNELGLGGKTAKISSLRSSSALACNVFDPWRGKALGSLTACLGLSGSFVEIRFEQKFNHGLTTIPPNIDVVLYEQDGAVVGIESKFTEIYGNKKAHPPLDGKYFSGSKTRWTDLGLPSCQRVADEVGRGMQFRRLGVGQLLKHILGLGRHHAKRALRLAYVWYDNGSEEANEHRSEVQQLHAAIDRDLAFTSLTYQELFRRLVREPEPATGYLEYLRARYFPSEWLHSPRSGDFAAQRYP